MKLMIDLSTDYDSIDTDALKDIVEYVGGLIGGGFTSGYLDNPKGTWNIERGESETVNSTEKLFEFECDECAEVFSQEFDDTTCPIGHPVKLMFNLHDKKQGAESDLEKIPMQHRAEYEVTFAPKGGIQGFDHYHVTKKEEK